MSSPTGPPGSAALARTDPLRVGAFHVQRRLGAGGMGLVYLARAVDGTPVAVKVIRPEYADDPVYRRRFRREAEAAARVRHPGVAGVLAADGDGSSPYLVTEYVPGPSLREQVARAGPLGGREVEAFAAAVAAALAAIHAAGIVHRDLKPANVILGPTGPRIVDFGIARAQDATTRYTSPGEIVGSMGWIAPEVLQQAPVTIAADVFAWGALVAFAGTGRRPFGDGADVSVAHRVLAAPPPDLTGLPATLLPMVAAALAPDPRARPSAAALAGGALAGGAGRTTWPPPTDRSDRTRTLAGPGWAAPRRPVVRVVLGCVGVVAAVAALLGALARQPSSSAGGVGRSSATAPATTSTRPPAAAPRPAPSSSHTRAAPRPAASPAPRQGHGGLVAAVVPPVRDGDVVFRLTDLRCGLATVGHGASAQDEPEGVRACTVLVTARNVGVRPHFLLTQTLIGSDGRRYGSNGFLTPRLGRPVLEAHTLEPGESRRSALVWELPDRVRPVAVEFHGDLLSLGTRRALR